ncbi:4a-hydroxytetrahydrobiopterin dehydratase [Acidiferrimicrobium sp. IK]|uniref:4a-hydroxytetrahydrobiopterin dehydratase n=1 Tax=Acidiferrimicrobium sp. IK TaxID=2871700 RepID=UPI0021CB0B59|nr:4a-hydroxytetrahydrobiopterin dehydratase [Acidiferrimicrobium sp. IK]MCU4183935.1 4a-hydroxytetrahydrobiopterin dehydratase [Acidiferrimicrobium sp. IK]
MPDRPVPLPAADLAHAVAALDGWEGDLEGITRTIETDSFPAAIDLVRAVADIAEEMNHHPDIDIRWRTVTFTLRTHDAGGVTKLDIDQAKRIDALVAGD